MVLLDKQLLHDVIIGTKKIYMNKIRPISPEVMEAINKAISTPQFTGIENSLILNEQIEEVHLAIAKILIAAGVEGEYAVTIKRKAGEEENVFVIKGIQ